METSPPPSAVDASTLDASTLDAWTFDDGLWTARDAGPADVSVCFAGKGLPPGRRPPGRRAAVERLASGAGSASVEPAWVDQVHSAVVRDARAGSCGEGDALVTDRSGLALSVVTADCVPVLLAGPTGIAAVHAGWRGVVARIVEAAVDRLGEPPAVAWIGPAISGEVYEVSPEVADQVVAVSDADVRHMGPRGRPHVDLSAAVAHQLRRAGAAEIRRISGCTLRDEERLWSYRRDGAGAGRNVSVIWRG